jgi:hypothetical protein
MPGNDQSFDVDAYLRYIFGEENEPEQVGEQELHRPVQAPWPIGSDIGVTVLGRTIDILQRKCDEQFAIHRAKDPELLGGMIDDPPEEPPSPVLIESLMPRKEWAEDLCDSVKTQAACGFIIARGGRVNLDPDDVVARLERILGGVDVPDEVEHRQRDILRMQVMDGICYQARDMEMERFRGDIMRAIARCQALLEEAQQPQEPPSASSSVGGGGSGHLE